MWYKGAMGSCYNFPEMQDWNISGTKDSKQPYV